MALAREGCEVVINGLNEPRLEATASELRAIATAKVTAVRADINTEEGRLALVAACPDADILVNNNAGPAPGNFQDWGHKEWMVAIEANMLAPIFMIRAVLQGMRQRKFGRIVNITSAMVKSPKFPEMGLSTAARTALTGLSKSLSRTVIVDNVTINNLLPERIDTDRQVFMAQRIMKENGISMEAARTRIADSLPAKRFGRPEEFGDTCAFLCSVQAGFMTGQNLQLDGGSYEGIV
jgi:3-oxoacyl-[acyl-carrier protein] reductase